MPTNRYYDIERYLDVITIHNMKDSSSVSSFLRAIRSGIDAGFRSFKIIWNGNMVYPNACVPIAGIISYYREQCGIEFSYEATEQASQVSYLENCGFYSPICATSDEIKRENNPFSKLYRFDTSTQVHELAYAYGNYIGKIVECSPGVIDALMWSLNEIMDNIFIHSNAGCGFVMAQYHYESKRVVICIYDSGVGIYNSLRESKHSPSSPTDAIQLAIREGVGDGKGMGNGLFGLHQIVKENKGTFSITSGPSSITFDSDNQMRVFDRVKFISHQQHSTIIDFQLAVDQEINLKRAFHSLGGFDGFDIRIDNMLGDDDMLEYDIFENSHGTATRESGSAIRNDILNILARAESGAISASGIILDFSNVRIISSSFADEVLAKLLLKLGPIRFNQVIHISNMNENVRHLCDRSIFMRVHSEWDQRSIIEGE